jgi:gluconolactonase
MRASSSSLVHLDRLPLGVASRAAVGLKGLLCLGLVGLLTVGATAQSPSQSLRTLGRIERLDPALDPLLDGQAPIEILADGFTWTEGPVWVERAGEAFLLFNDIPRNTTFRWDPQHGISRFMQPSGYTGVAYYGLEPGANGLILDSQGRLIMCEHGDRRVSRLAWDGGKQTLADNYRGARLNSPNDAVLHSSGAIYFTDPPYGLPQRERDPRRELDHFGVYRIAPDGQLQLITTQLQRPNGIGLSPDEQTLYVAQSDPAAAIIMAFTIDADGGVGEGRVLADWTDQVGKLPGLPDGLAVDSDGNLWCSGPGGVYVLSAEGKLLGRILTGERTSNCTFGGPQRSTLFITADSYLLKVETKSRGLR